MVGEVGVVLSMWVGWKAMPLGWNFGCSEAVLYPSGTNIQKSIVVLMEAVFRPTSNPSVACFRCCAPDRCICSLLGLRTADCLSTEHGLKDGQDPTSRLSHHRCFPCSCQAPRHAVGWASTPSGFQEAGTYQLRTIRGVNHMFQLQRTIDLPRLVEWIPQTPSGQAVRPGMCDRSTDP